MVRHATRLPSKRSAIGSVHSRVGVGVAPAALGFGYMFPELQQDEANVLKPERATVEALRALGAAMTDVPEAAPVGGAKGPGDSAIPAIYTYFGQFLDHDTALDETSASMPSLAVLRPYASFVALGPKELAHAEARPRQRLRRLCASR